MWILTPLCKVIRDLFVPSEVLGDISLVKLIR